MASPFQFRRVRQYFSILVLIFVYIVTSGLMLFALKTSVRNHFKDLWIEEAFQLTNQVERAANFESLPMENLGEEKRQEVQELLRRLTLGGSVIEEIFLIGTNNQVLFSSKPSLQESFEKRPYVQDKYLSKQKELLFYNRTDSTVAISVFKPVDYNTRRLGNLRLNVVISDLRAAKSTEFSMLLGCGIFLLVVGIIFFYLAFNSRKIHLPGVERAREEESPEKQE
ncbi:MAG TPA: hypothetical protein PKV71_04720, partial [Calditrichia bacterium]|nr:hypothetical protein [Calditrichia bacterium]